VDYAEHIAAIEDHGARLAASFAAGPMDSRVPTCPEWHLRDLAGHVWDFTGFWTHVLCEATGRPKTPFGSMPDAPGDGYRELVGHLAEELRAATADTPTWGWVPSEQRAGYAARRCANELAVHGVDAALARGGYEPIAASQAADIIDETFTFAEAREAKGSGETMHLHGSEGDEWMITIAADGMHVEHAHGKGDLALRGAASDLAMTLYGRPVVGPIERFGDESVLDVWRTAFRF
jgi:uncharacterized protein (TIGR03083 family)